MSRARSRTWDVVIVGAGFAGLGAAIRLKQQGIEDFVILERSDRVGGTWRDNTYPGAACDIPSLLYSYSFAPNPSWSRAYSGSREILGYIDAMVEQFDLAPHLRFGVDVADLAYDERLGRWTASAAGGATFHGRTAIFASGPLSNASLPAIEGVQDFEGITLHSARWDHDVSLAGKRVAVIGTGASAVQIIPELVRTAASVKVFQRTPGWVMPKTDVAHPALLKELFRRVPATQAAARQALYWTHEALALGMVWDTPVTSGLQLVSRAHLRLTVKDPWLRRQLTPDFRIGCKRTLVTSDYYPALQQENCKLITWPIQKVVAGGVRTVEGIEHRVDAIVYATGFDVSTTGTPFPIHGTGGRELGAEWAGGAAAYKSVSVAGYPNLFLTFGPNSGPGHNSALVYMESAINHIVEAIGTVLREDLHSLDVRPEVQDGYNRRMQRRLGRTTWNSGCSSWYLTPDGYNGSMYPGFATQYLMQMRRFRRQDYEMVARTPVNEPLAEIVH